MEVKLKELTVRELVEDYQDNSEEGVSGYGGKLDIRPPFQREFVYNDNQREAGFSANIITRLKRNEYIKLQSVESICRALDCGVDDILKFVSDED